MVLLLGQIYTVRIKACIRLGDNFFYLSVIPYNIWQLTLQTGEPDTHGIVRWIQILYVTQNISCRYCHSHGLVVIDKEIRLGDLYIQTGGRYLAIGWHQFT